MKIEEPTEEFLHGSNLLCIVKGGHLFFAQELLFHWEPLKLTIELVTSLSIWARVNTLSTRRTKLAWDTLSNSSPR